MPSMSLLQPAATDDSNLDADSASSVPGAAKPRVTFITNFAPHYRVKTFELLAERYDTRFIYYSRGGEANWLKEHGVSTGRFRYQYLWGFSVAGVRIAPRLVPLAWSDDSDVTIKCINGKFALPVVFLACMARRRPSIIWTGDWSVGNSPAYRAAALFNRVVYQRADAIVTYGAHVTRHLIGQGVSPNKIFTSRHAVTNSEYARPVAASEIAALRARLGVPESAKIVLFVGRLVPIKGLTYLMQGFAEACRADDSYLVLAGTGPEQRPLEELARGLGIGERVRFSGYIRPQDTPVYYAASYLSVLPSVTWGGVKETWGLVVNEAFNQGVPVIATDAVGAAAGGLILDGENGFVVPEQNAEAIAASLHRLLSDPGLRERMSVNARDRIEGWDQVDMVGAFSQAIQYVLQMRAHRATPGGRNQ
jgi:glycosyltransferase involved in cell wall biosynthesis